MALPESVRYLIDAARRRLTLMGVLASFFVAVAIAGAVAASLLGLSRVMVIMWAEPVAWTLIAAASVGSMLVAFIRRPSRMRAALAVDRKLGGFDRVTTAVELTERGADLSESEERVVRSAESWSASRRVDRLGRLLPKGPLPQLAVLTLAASLLMTVLPSTTDDAVAAFRAERERIEAEADAIEDMADDAPDELSEDLDALAEQLRASESIDEALELLGDAREELLAALDPGALAKKTAMAGLEQSLAADPLAPGETAADQLEALADRLDGLSREEAAAASAELAERAADFAGVDSELSRALEDAADGLRIVASAQSARDITAEALQRAAEGVRRISGEVATATAQAGAAGELREAQRRLDGGDGSGGEGSGSGEGEGQGSGSGEGEGQGSGQGQGQGSGQGQRGGQGSGGAGGGQGQGGQSGGGTGSGSGSGQVPSGTGDDDPFAQPSRGDIFDPTDFSPGDEVRIPIEGSDPGDLLGTSSGSGISNDAIVPYSRRFAEYQRTALESLDSLTVTPGIEAIVRDYFTRLEP